jgi:hypothetical protein
LINHKLITSDNKKPVIVKPQIVLPERSKTPCTVMIRGNNALINEIKKDNGNNQRSLLSNESGKNSNSTKKIETKK